MSVAILISTEEQKLFSFDDEGIHTIQQCIKQYVGDARILSFDLACSDKVTGDDAADLYEMLDELQDSTW
ncbi:hypothetical protein [Yersinia phage MHG19]|nr:hypothetical protein [Yersinia phage MHG19]